MAHGPNRFRSEKREAHLAAQRSGLPDEVIVRVQRVIAAWNVRARRREAADFFPTFAAALAAGATRLTYLCPACQRLDYVDLRIFADAHHPRAPVSVVIPKLSCQWCCPNPPLAVLVELGSLGDPLPVSEPEPVEHRPRLDPRDYPVPPVPTMEDLPSHDVTELLIWCGRWPHTCSYQSSVPLTQVDLRKTIVQFAARLQCPECGTVGGQAMPHWPSRGGGPGGAHNHGELPMPEYIAPDEPAPIAGKRRSRKAR